MNQVDYLLLAVVVICFLGALRSVLVSIKNNKGCIGCNGDCSSCKSKDKNNKNTDNTL
ncbi:MAG: FeoB-associated Cys-rich membrane protein [Lachnospiraceae bacterium]|nr:FeoB-associated Cys-rich membrane protein [Lachnospiraceae bacterium]